MKRRNTRINWTNEITNKLIKLYKNEMPMKDIAEEIGASTNSIGQRLFELRQSRKVGRRRPYEYWGKRELRTLKTMKKNGSTRSEIAKRLDRTLGQIDGMLQRV